MRSRVLVVFAVVVAMLAVSVAPAGAKGGRAIKGDQDIAFNLGLVLEVGAAQDVSWFGEVTLGGATYPIVYNPTAEPKPIWGGRATLFLETLTVYDAITYSYEEGVLTAFDVGNMIFTATDRAICLESGHCFSAGRITDVDTAQDTQGALRSLRVGDRTFWSGFMPDPEAVTFDGPFTIVKRWWRR